MRSRVSAASDLVAGRPRHGGARPSKSLQTCYQIKTVSSFLSLELELKCPCGGQREKITLPDYSPRPSAASGARHSSIVLLDANIDVFAKTSVKMAFGVSKNVNAVGIHRAFGCGGGI